MNHGEFMQKTKMNFDRILRGEESSSNKINIISHYDDSTLQDKSCKLIQIIKLAGLNSVTKADQTLDAYKNRLNNLLKSFSSEFAFYFWEVRRTVSSCPGGSFYQKFAKNVHQYK